MLDMSELLSIEGLPGIEGELVPAHEPLELVPITSNPTDRKIDLESDYELVRRNLNYQSQMLMDMAQIALENAKNSESPNHVTAFSGLMTQFANTNKEILRVHKEMKEITSEETKTNQATPDSKMTIENANVFVGSPAELMMQIGSSQDTKQELVIDGRTE